MPYVDTGWQGLKYGFKWWLYPRKAGQFVWMGIGFGGQRLMVFPDEQLIATFTGWDILEDPAVDAELVNRLVPAILSTRCPEEAH
jgi:CubicO group peptidase (beta-lactamase class C family)